ncbi:hypothetical protein RF11_16039 [Thelohanellus kitauei]|uniref:Uncharacterized protein n=1 Tax=Thelohanellus kitauei TaxID=669202 RepID=A0A0C2MQG7_THEKT|nr:hypothetical protein RF11_16039 [Thelohanellus kitauei]
MDQAVPLGTQPKDLEHFWNGSRVQDIIMFMFFYQRKYAETLQPDRENVDESDSIASKNDINDEIQKTQPEFADDTDLNLQYLNEIMDSTTVRTWTTLRTATCFQT